MVNRVAPATGLATWPEPDPGLTPGETIQGGLPVELIEQRPDGWAKVRCSNGWEAWVDGRLLVTAEESQALVSSNRAPRGSDERKRMVTVAGVLAALVVVAVLAVLAGRDNGGSNSRTGVGAGRPDIPNRDDRDLLDAEAIEQAVAAVLAEPVDEGRAIADVDEAAGRRISQEFAAAGVDLGPDVMVMPFSGESTMLYLRADENNPLLTGDNRDRLFETLSSSKAVADAKVSRITLDLVGNDERGPYTLTLTVGLDDLLRAQRDDVDSLDKMGVQLERG